MEFNATFLVSAISFIIFVFLMNMIFYAPLEKIIFEREKLVDDTLNEAKLSRDNAASLLKEREEKLNKAYEDSKLLVNEKMQKANQKAKTLTSDAKLNSFNEINELKADIHKQAEDAKTQLDQSARDIADQITSKILG